MKSCGRVMFNFVQYLWLSHFDWTHGFVIASPADSSFMSFGLLLFWLNFHIMTKRDSVVANLPSPRDLRMAFAQDLDTPMEPVSGYSATAPRPPIPSFEDTSFFPHPHITTGSELQPHEYRQRTVHTSTFKVFAYGRKAPELLVEELDDTGYMKIKTPETLFHGIVGHVRDRHGQRVDGWAQTATLANYWRRYYNMTENTWPYHDYDDSQQDNLPQSTDPSVEAPVQCQVPQPSTQLSHLLRGILLQDPDGYSSILETLNVASSSSSASLNHDGLAHLAGCLAILSHYLARRGTVNTEMPEGYDL